MLSVATEDFLAICTVAAFALGLIGWIVSTLRHAPFTLAQSALYVVNYLLVRILWRMQVAGEIGVSHGQGAILVCNHRCPLDPAFIAATTTRVVHWMVAKEYCEYPVFRELLQTCEVIPVRRGAIDLPAVRNAIRLVQQGEIVGLFPEGRINTTSQLLLPGHFGAALIALKARVPVIPCCIHGAPYDGTTLGCLVMPAAVRLVIGRPIDLSAYEDRGDRQETLDEITGRFLREIAKFAGQPDFEPTLIKRAHKTDK
jgi:1-acyl-sn-glycerol-3-phosphate acyltransferase